MTESEILNKFSEAAHNPHQWVKDYIEANNVKAIARFCSYFPDELLHAAGLLPVRIAGTDEPSPKVSLHLQSYCCFIIKDALDQLLTGKLDFLQGVLFTHSCDSMQCLTDIAKINSTFPFFDCFNMPAQFSTQSSHEYLINELYRLKREIELFTQQTITDEQLKRSCQIYNEFRRLVRELYERRKENPEWLTFQQMNDIINSASIMPLNYFLQLLKSLINNTAQVTSQKLNQSKLIIVGSVCNDVQFYQLIEEELDGIIIDDDLCNGSRYFEGDVENLDEPIKGIADRLLNRIICPCKHHQDMDRGEYLINKVKSSNANGVVFYLHKYCDPHFFDYPYLKEQLDAANISSILIEMEKPGYHMEQVKSRMQAFMEKLGND